jgi:hypothetical protein
MALHLLERTQNRPKLARWWKWDQSWKAKINQASSPMSLLFQQCNTRKQICLGFRRGEAGPEEPAPLYCMAG